MSKQLHQISFILSEEVMKFPCQRWANNWKLYVGHHNIHLCFLLIPHFLTQRESGKHGSGCNLLVRWLFNSVMST